MNFIFDVGNVLVEYAPVVYLRRLFSDEDLINKMVNVIFKSPEWLQMDEGFLLHKEATEIFCKREPEYIDAIKTVMQNFDKTFFPLSDTINLLPEIKKAGHDLYYLSNIHVEIRDHLVNNHDFFDLFIGGVFSCDINHIKPSPEIYRYLLTTYSLNPQDCVFFDDMEENVEAAEKEGIKSVHFTTAECVLKFM